MFLVDCGSVQGVGAVYRSSVSGAFSMRKERHMSWSVTHLPSNSAIRELEEACERPAMNDQYEAVTD